MKKILPLIIALALFSTPALAENHLPYLITARIKTFHSAESYPGKEVEVMVRILTHTDVELLDRKGSILYALKFHDMLCDAFMRQGWRVTHPLSEKLDAGSLELTFEPRMKRVVMKIFIYPCGNDPLWNMMKYRGGSYEKYFDSVASKAQASSRPNTSCLRALRRTIIPPCHLKQIFNPSTSGPSIQGF